jgi:hypothetical protein
LTVRGFQKIPPAWTDGYSALPLQHTLLASGKESKRLCGRRLTSDDKRLPGYKQHTEAVQSMPDVTIAMLKRAKRWKIHARTRSDSPVTVGKGSRRSVLVLERMDSRYGF